MPTRSLLPLVLLALASASCASAGGPRASIDAAAPSASRGAAAPAPRRAQEPAGSAAADELAQKTQNPVADLISLPFQNNTGFDTGPDDRTRNVLNIQPVLPHQVGEDWNLIHRLIAPVITQPGFQAGETHTTGIGDLSYSAFLSPISDTGLTWGVGPALSIPTASSDRLGTGKWAAGPSIVVLGQPGPWTIGALANHVWSFAGDDDRGSVNASLIQPFVAYGLPGGWTVNSSPILTANWQAGSDERWTIPVGAGVAKVVMGGGVPINLSLQAYANVERPTFAPEWELRVVVAFLFPK